MCLMHAFQKSYFFYKKRHVQNQIYLYGTIIHFWVVTHQFRTTDVEGCLFLMTQIKSQCLVHFSSCANQAQMCLFPRCVTVKMTFPCLHSKHDGVSVQVFNILLL